MELEEAIRNLKDEINVDKNNLPIAEANEYEEERTLMLNRIEAKETLLNHLTKQEKMIDTIITELAYYDNYICHSIECEDIGCKKCLKQYFEKKVEDLIE